MTWSRPPQPTREQRIEARQAPRVPALLKPLRQGSYSGVVGAGAPKTEAYRDTALLEMARGRQCMFGVPGVCIGGTETTVQCHSNESAHGKAKSRKADDHYSAAGCAACHEWYDRGPAPKDVKRLAFTLAHLNQVNAWRAIAVDQQEPERYRRAARRALERLNATPIPEEV